MGRRLPRVLFRSQTIVTAVVALARAMGLEVAADRLRGSLGNCEISEAA